MHCCLIAIRYALILSGFILLAGCMVGRALVVEPTPWYQQESGAHYAAENRVFYGIGKAEGTRNTTLLRATAANRARKEMAKVLDRYVTALFQNAGAMPALTMEEGEQVIGTIVRQGVERSVISDQWRDEQQTHLYVLCRLELDTFKQMLAAQTAIDDKTRSAMMAQTENVHSQLAGTHGRPHAPQSQ